MPTEDRPEHPQYTHDNFFQQQHYDIKAHRYYPSDLDDYDASDFRDLEDSSPDHDDTNDAEYNSNHHSWYNEPALYESANNTDHRTNYNRPLYRIDHHDQRSDYDDNHNRGRVEWEQQWSGYREDLGEI